MIPKFSNDTMASNAPRIKGIKLNTNVDGKFFVFIRNEVAKSQIAQIKEMIANMIFSICCISHTN